MQVRQLPWWPRPESVQEIAARTSHPNPDPIPFFSATDELRRRVRSIIARGRIQYDPLWSLLATGAIEKVRKGNNYELILLDDAAGKGTWAGSRRPLDHADSELEPPPKKRTITMTGFHTTLTQIYCNSGFESALGA